MASQRSLGGDQGIQPGFTAELSLTKAMIAAHLLEEFAARLRREIEQGSLRQDASVYAALVEDIAYQLRLSTSEPA